MSTVFSRTTSGTDWIAVSLDARRPHSLGEAPTPGVVVMACEESGFAALLAPRGVPVRVNGMPVHAGLRVLADRDEIRVGSQRHYFSEHDAPATGIHDGESTPCARCGGWIESGDAIARCSCGVIYHQDGAAHDCFSYGPCVVCRTDPLPIGVAPWTPESL